MTAKTQEAHRPDHYSRLIELGIALSAEHDHARLLERILVGAKEMANADGGTLYLTEGEGLAFAIMRNDSLDIAKGGTTGEEITFPPLPLYRDGAPNHNNVATHVALSGETVNVPDAYEAEGFDFSGTRKFDQGTGYRSMSFLTVPLKDRDGKTIGVLQLINAQPEDRPGDWVPFSAEIRPLIEALASQAAVALENQRLLEAQRNLLDSFIKVIADSIDAKSPYTGGHCKRVPVITEMLAEAANDDAGPLAGFSMNENDRYELSIAAWLHDCGKILTPEHVVDKSTKLECIHDRVNEVALRFEVLKQQITAAHESRRAAGEAVDDAALAAELARIDDDRAFIEEANTGGEFMAEEKLERVRAIATRTWVDPEGRERPLLTENEVYNLSIQRGTLTTEERQVINDHVVHTINMLEKLPFPDYLQHVPEYAGGHHEKMDGTGYPQGLTGDELSVQARVMAIADIFEALTAADRPYKTPKTVSEALKIMSFMRNDNHIDADLFDVFLRSGVWRDYAETYLRPEQLDDVDIARYMRPAAE